MLFKFPEPINREEIKRVFWNTVEPEGRDASLRVALSTLNKLLNEADIASFYESRNGFVYLKNGYTISSDIKEFNLIYNKGKNCYKKENLFYVKSILRPFYPG